MKARLNSLSLPTRRQPVRQLRPVALDDRARISSEIASIRSKSSAVFVRPFEIGWHHDVAADASGRVDAPLRHLRRIWIDSAPPSPTVSIAQVKRVLNRWFSHLVAPILGTMKGFGKIALVFGLLGGLMCYFIIPLQSTRSRALSPTDKAEYALTVSHYKKHCGPVAQNIEENAKAYARELSGENIWAGIDAMLQHRRPLIGWPTWCRYIGALWLNRA